MKRAIVASFLVCALIATAGCLDDGDTEADATMTMQEVSDDFSQSIDQGNMTMTVFLKSLDEGDTLLIKDTIANITYNEQNESTAVSFASTSSSSAQLRFEGDITDEFSSGDTVAVTTGIINVTMTQQSQQGQVTYHYETFEEGWDAANNKSVPFPRSTIEHAEAIEDTDDTDDGDDTSGSSTMTFSAFWNDYAQSVDNESLVATTYLKSLDDGDTVTIEDTLHNLSYNATRDYTLIQFSSVTQRVLGIEGDITGEFQAGDAVSLTSKIINATFTYPVQGQNWTIHYETFAGGWDTENNTQAPFPRDALQHAD
ncbi:MAG: hypothetical protein ACP5FL_07625 [Thermoplasmatota archaeon]